MIVLPRQAGCETELVNARPPAGYEIDSEFGRIDIDRVHHWLSSDAFWALGRTRESVETAARHSVNFGVFAADGAQVAYARVVTDYSTFAWLCDVYVDRGHRGRGLGTRLAETVVARFRPMGLKRMLLSTLDAHGVYARAGFVPLSNPDKIMVLGVTDQQPATRPDPPMSGHDSAAVKDCSVFHERFKEAAERVLLDDSIDAARSLEGVVLHDYPGDERLDDLLEALALYNPGEGAPYVHADGLRSAVRAAWTRLGSSEPE